MKKKMPREKVFEYIEEDYIMMDKRGRWWAQEECPALNRSSPVCWTGGICFPLYIAIDYDGPWEDSLMERPREKVLYYIDCGEVILTTEPKVIIHCYEAPHMVANWFHKVMEESK